MFYIKECWNICLVLVKNVWLPKVIFNPALIHKYIMYKLFDTTSQTNKFSSVKLINAFNLSYLYILK